MPLYIRKNIPPVYGAAFLPRRVPRSHSLNIDWQASSQLFFLSSNQELLHLISDSDVDAMSPSVAFSSDNPQPLPYTPFGAVLAKQIQSVNDSRTDNQNFTGSGSIGETGKASIREVSRSIFYNFIYVICQCDSCQILEFKMSKK